MQPRSSPPSRRSRPSRPTARPSGCSGRREHRRRALEPLRRPVAGGQDVRRDRRQRGPRLLHERAARRRRRQRRAGLPQPGRADAAASRHPRARARRSRQHPRARCCLARLGARGSRRSCSASSGSTASCSTPASCTRPRTAGAQRRRARARARHELPRPLRAHRPSSCRRCCARPARRVVALGSMISRLLDSSLEDLQLAGGYQPLAGLRAVQDRHAGVRLRARPATARGIRRTAGRAPSPARSSASSPTPATRSGGSPRGFPASTSRAGSSGSSTTCRRPSRRARIAAPGRSCARWPTRPRTAASTRARATSSRESRGCRRRARPASTGPSPSASGGSRRP